MARITTVIPTYRRPRLVARAIQSVLNQTYEDFEVHVFDDASGDSTAEVVRGFQRRDSRVKYFRQPNNLGMVPNTQYSVRSVRSPLFTILNDDDYLLPEFFSTAIKAFDRYRDAHLFIGRLITLHMLDPNRTRPCFRAGRYGYYRPLELYFELVPRGELSTWTSMMFRREVLESVGGIDRELGYQSDLEFELRVMSHFASVISPVPCGVYYMHPNSGSFDDWLTPYVERVGKVLDKIAADPAFDPKTRQEMAASLRSVFRFVTFMGARMALFLKDNNREVGLQRAQVGAQALKDCLDARWASSFISFAAADSQAGRIIRHCLKPLRGLRRSVRRRRLWTEYHRLAVDAADNIDQTLARAQLSEEGWTPFAAKARSQSVGTIQ